MQGATTHSQMSILKNVRFPGGLLKHSKLQRVLQKAAHDSLHLLEAATSLHK